jgi:hypothetical protein
VTAAAPSGAVVFSVPAVFTALVLSLAIAICDEDALNRILQLNRTNELPI